MTLIKSISGFRGTIGGIPGENLTPVDLVSLTTGYAQWLLNAHDNPTVVIGRDGRISGPMVSSIVKGTLLMSGVHVIDLGLTSTPTVEMAVILESAQGGIILSASHNPMNWNALKLLNEKGEFLTSDQGKAVIDLADRPNVYVTYERLGSHMSGDGYPDKHIEAIRQLELVNADMIRKSEFKVVVDCINSSGAAVIPPLLDALGVKYVLINEELSDSFAHNPEPLEENLTDLISSVVAQGADLGIAVDPDVDRLALVDERGRYFGEEYTLVAVADYILSHDPGPVVTNMSSSIALKDIADRYGCAFHTSAVGEAHVVAKMKAVDAVLGGEGNGGIIDPNLHYGRDALVGIAYILSSMATRNARSSELRDRLPNYTISKQKISLGTGIDPDDILQDMFDRYKNAQHDLTDGLKLYFDAEWVHLRKSNTEPIIRIYAESNNKSAADALALRFVDEIKDLP